MTKYKFELLTLKPTTVKKNQFNLLFTLLGILVLFTSCQEEIINLEESDEVQTVIGKELSLDQIPHLNQVNSTLQRINNNLSSNQTGRTLDADSTSIVTDDILYMTYGNTHTYTFKLIRENPEFYVENLVLHYNVETETYDEYLVQYDMSAQEYLDFSNGIPLPEDVETTIIALDNGTFSGIANRGFWMTTCTTIYYNCTAGGNHSYGEACQGDPDQQPGYIEICSSVYYDTNPTIDAGPSPEGGTIGGGVGDGYVATNPRGNEPCDTSSGGIGISGSDGCNSTVNEILITNLESIIEAPLGYETTASYRERLSAIGEYFTLASHTDFAGLDEMLTDAINDPGLSIDDLGLMWEKTKEAYDILKPYALQLAGLDSLDDMSVVVPPLELATAERNLTEVAFLPQVKTLLANWPISVEQWAALGEILFQPQFLLEIGVGFIPSSSIIDVVSGLDEGDYLAVTFGIAGLVIDAFGGTIIKAIGKIGKVAYKGFKIFKLALKYLNEVKNSIVLGFKTLLDGNTVKILNSSDNVIARIVNNVLTFNYTGFGGDIVANSSKTTTILGRYIDDTGKGTKEILDSGLSEYGENLGGFNLLNEPNWSNLTQAQRDILNKNWLEEAFQRGDDIRLISNPATNQFVNGTITQYCKELNWIDEFLDTYDYSFNSLTNTYIKN